MKQDTRTVPRRTFLASMAALGVATSFASPSIAAVPPLTKAIPKTGDRLPVVGMGSWLTFSVGGDGGGPGGARSGAPGVFRGRWWSD